MPSFQTPLLQGILTGESLPFSLRYKAMPIAWRKRETESSEDEFDTLLQAEGLPIQARCRGEWNQACNFLRFEVRLRATEALEGRISQVRILDLCIDHDDIEAPCTFLTFTGGSSKHYSHEGPASFPNVNFEREAHVMRGLDIRRFRDETGRGSNEYIPLWLYGDEDSGVWFGPEWQGSWALEVHRLPERSALQVELPCLDFKLHQDEEIVLPPMVLGLYAGDLEDGLNTVRRTIRKCFLPPYRGKEPEPECVYQMLGEHPEAFAENGQLEREISRVGRIGAKAFTPASCWQWDRGTSEDGYYWWDGLGKGAPSQDRFPSGMCVVSENLARQGVDLGLWIDPRIGVKHPQKEAFADFLLEMPAAMKREIDARYNDWSHQINRQPLVDLGTERGAQFIHETLERYVNEYGAKRIWWDLNTDPRPYFWEGREEADRRGLMELAYFQGMNKLLTAFRESHPDVWIEMCASGGRMINLAVMRYSHSCWITDYVGTDPDICAGIRGGANELFPAVHNHQSFYFPKECEDAKAEFPTAAVLGHFAGVLGVGQWLCRVSECHLDEFARLVRRYGEVRDYLKGDYYRLIRAVDRRGWEAWQFHDPERGAGILIVLRLSENTQSGIHFSLRGFFASLPPQVRVIEGTAHVSVEKSDVTLDLKTSRACLLHYTS